MIDFLKRLLRHKVFLGYLLWCSFWLVVAALGAVSNKALYYATLTTVFTTLIGLVLFGFSKVTRGWVRVVLNVWVVATFLALIVTGYFRQQKGGEWLSDFLGLFAFTSMGALSYLIVFTVATAVGLWAVSHSRDRRSDAVPAEADEAEDPQILASRRAFVQRGTQFVGAATVFSSVASYSQARELPPVREQYVSMPRWPKDTKPLRVVQICDIHAGQTIKRDYIAGVAAKAAALNPDLVVLIGDLVDGSVSNLGDDVEPLTQIPSRYGTYFVTGNHEYYSEVDQWIDYWDASPVTYLRNQHDVLEHEGHKVVVAGVNDHRAATFGPQHAPDPEAAVAGAPLEESIGSIVLAHQPKSIFSLDHLGLDLQLSGHTHGGQFAPWTWVIHWVQPYVWGLHQHKKMQIYVSRGSGYWGPPMRLGAPHEITLLTVGA